LRFSEPGMTMLRHSGESRNPAGRASARHETESGVGVPSPRIRAGLDTGFRRYDARGNDSIRNDACGYAGAREASISVMEKRLGHWPSRVVQSMRMKG
jgi:hypothetical protein